MSFFEDLTPKKVVGIVLAVFMAIFVVIALFTSVYTVDEQSQAVVTTFGKVTSVEDAGLKFKIPFVQKRTIVPVNMSQKITVGYYYDKHDELVIVEDESRIMTGDDNLVCVDFFIEWKISDPVAYLYGSNDPEGILKALAQSSARNIIGSELVDEVLTTGKERIQTEIEDVIHANLSEYGIGIQVLDVKIQDAEPPTMEVKAAFKSVEDAKIEKETMLTEATTYEKNEVPKAQSQADKLLQEAEAYYQSRVAEAQGEVERFNSIYTEYARYSDVTRTRMYLEVIEELFPGMKVFINTTEGGTSTLIPADIFASAGGVN